jgi:putative transposase
MDMPIRKVPLAVGEIYHVVTRSIANFKVFNYDEDYRRIIDEMRFYCISKPPCKYSIYKSGVSYNTGQKILAKLAKIMAYCIMPTHIHLLLEEICENGITRFMSRILNSYSRYFNIKHNRKGPLWEARFKNVLIKTDEQLMHTIRYIHLNPVTDRLAERPLDWDYSSYKEYMKKVKDEERLCSYEDHLNIDPESYAIFVNDRIDYQRQLAVLKHLWIE